MTQVGDEEGMGTASLRRVWGACSRMSGETSGLQHNRTFKTGENTQGGKAARQTPAQSNEHRAERLYQEGESVNRPQRLACLLYPRTSTKCKERAAASFSNTSAKGARKRKGKASGGEKDKVRRVPPVHFLQDPNTRAL